MPSFRNYKICDNAPECDGIRVCPVKAITFNEETQSVEIDNEKCISCGLCENACPIGAFRVAKTEEEAIKIQEEIENDLRTTKDLFVDRYGAAPLSEFFMIDANEIESKVENKELVLIECYTEDNVNCLLKSIPIKELTSDLPDTTLFFKASFEADKENKYELNDYPSLLIFKSGKLAGKIEGYFEEDKKEELKKQISNIINA